MAGATKYIPTFIRIIPIPKDNISASELISTKFKIDNVDSIGVIKSFTASLKIGFSRSKSAIRGENE